MDSWIELVPVLTVPICKIKRLFFFMFYQLRAESQSFYFWILRKSSQKRLVWTKGSFFRYSLFFDRSVKSSFTETMTKRNIIRKAFDKLRSKITPRLEVISYCITL